MPRFFYSRSDRNSLKFAVLLAAHNGEKWISDQLNSIIDQEDVTLSIFISIDKSFDNTYKLCKDFSRKFPNIFIVSYKNKFGSSSSNFYYLISRFVDQKFDYVAFADQDDIWESNKLLKSHIKISQENADAYSSNVRAFWPSGRKKILIKNQPQKEWDYIFESAGPGCTFVLKINFFNSLRFFIETNKKNVYAFKSHDWLIYAFARSLNKKWIIDSYPGVNYRQHFDNELGANIGIKAYLFRARKIFNGSWFNQIYILTSLLGNKEKSFFDYYLLNKPFYFLFVLNKCRRRSRDLLAIFIFFLVNNLRGFRISHAKRRN
jgi:rhamnosyltransferase